MATPERRRIAVLSTGRQDWGILRTLCGLMREDPGFDLRLLLGGMHCSERFGRTSRLVESEGFQSSDELNWILGHGPLDAERQTGDAVWMVAGALRKHQAEALVLVGDR